MPLSGPSCPRDTTVPAPFDFASIGGLSRFSPRSARSPHRFSLDRPMGPSDA
jgi:hypothetical protein